MTDEARLAPENKVWVCMACGKRAQDRYGIEGWHSWGWDESCALNSVLVDEKPSRRLLEKRGF
jgi:hypothetical protein